MPTNLIVGASPVDPEATQGPYSVAGYWQLIVQNPRSGRQEVTWFRGSPTKLSSWSFADPFGAKEATFVFPGITYFDRIGEGDLDWCAKDSNISLYFNGTLPAGYPYQHNGKGYYSWEGFMTSFSFSAQGLSVTCKGAMYQLDNFLAKPEYLSRPLPYEYAIARQFYRQEKPSLRLGACQIVMPSWASAYVPPSKSTPNYLIPVYVKKGLKWTGLVTRSTGHWDKALTDYIQSLLSSMYTPYGRYTLDLLPGRVPRLFHQDFGLSVRANRTLVLDPASPGVNIGSLEQDFEQTFTTAYGQVRSASGLEYSGQEVYSDPVFATRTVYDPLAELRQTHVSYGRRSDWADRNIMVREQMLQMQDGLDTDTARDVATDHLARHADPGLTGEITLTSDPEFVTAVSYATGYPVVTASSTLSRYLIRPGMTVLIPGLLGNIEGVLLHISEVTCSETEVKLTLDSKNRDAMTVAEVRQRGRDSLSVPRSIIAGAYQPAVQDKLVPWNYGAGSGYIPSAPGHSSLSLFKGMPRGIGFPWSEWTTQRPPKDKAWRNCYLRIGPKDKANADNNWAWLPHGTNDPTGAMGKYAVPIRLAQAATIRLVQIAAYDKDGYVMRVPFHVSFYNQYGTNVASTPMINSALVAGRDGYLSGQHYPFFSQAWEQFTGTGATITNESSVSKSSAGLVRGYGTRYEPAGYWPGRKAAGDRPTGLLQDEGQWSWQAITSSAPESIGTVDTAPGHAQDRLAGFAFMLIYCDAQLAQEVFFLGRVYRTEPGGD